MTTSPFIYVNAALPRRYRPPETGGSRTLSDAEMRELLTLNDPVLEASPGDSVEERVFAVFEHTEVEFGPRGMLRENRDAWLERLSRFTSRRRPIEFVAMAFPYKSPNPLKTTRRAPDAGEALMLRRFAAVLRAVEEVYEPGGRLTILEEGILGRCQGVDPRSIRAYREGIDRAVSVSGIDPSRVGFHSLDDMGTAIQNFEARWIFEQERLRSLYEQGDPAVVHAHDETTAAQRASVPTWDFEPETLARAYDSESGDSELRYVRDYVDKVAHRQFFAYRALLTLRDATGYLGRLRPNALKMTVSPKPENIAVLPVNRWSGILPYHGVPVLRADGRWEILYYGGLGETVGELEELHLLDDGDPAPFAYRERA